MPQPGGDLRLTELLASLSLATDLGTGQPLGHGLRTCLLAVELAKGMGLESEHIRSVHQVSLLRFLGCTADSVETAEMAGGDDLTFNADMAPVLNGSQIEALRELVRAVAPREANARKTRMVLNALSNPGAPARGLAAHCEVAAMLARRLGLGERVTNALLSGYERWDGNGYPAGLEGEAIPVEIRIAMVARDIDLFSRQGADVREMLERRRGKAYDPAVVDASARLDVETPEADWEEVLAIEPQPVLYVGDLDSAVEVMADFVDLKSSWTRGHSRSVAELAKAAGIEAKLSADRCNELSRAGLVHDLGRVGIENGIWDKPGDLSTDEWEKVRLHPYWTDRILSRCPALAPLGALASSHHERIDGTGYHRQSTADQLTVEARLLAAADVLVALTSRRPHREPFDLEASATLMREAASNGRLDKSAVEWVIAATGGEAEAPGSNNPDGLTDREIEVLKLLSSGFTNRQVADQLFISAKTVGRHVENIYAKIGVSTRAGTAIYAMGNRLLD